MTRFSEAFLRKLTGLSRREKFFVLLTVDMALVPIGLWLTALISAGNFREALFMPLIPGVFLYLLLIPAAGILSYMMGLPRVKLNAYEQDGMLRTAVFAMGVGITGYFCLRILTDGTGLADAMAVFTMILLIFSVGTRVFMRTALIRLYQRGTRRQRVLIYGAGQTGAQLAVALGRDDAVVPVAFIDDNPSLNKITVGGLPVYQAIKVGALVKELSIDRVVLAMPSISRPIQARIARELEAIGCDVSMVPSFATLVGEGNLVDRIQSANPSDFLNRENLEGELDGLCDAYTGRSVMITGAGGSIGSELTRQILACAPKRLVLFEISEYALYQLTRELDELGLKTSTEIVTVLGSVMNSATVARALTGYDVDIVLHTAAYKHVGIVENNLLAGLRNNVIGTKILADAAREAGVSRLILISTDKAVRPTSMMGASKRLAEMVIQDLASRSGRKADTRFSLVRFGNVLGSSGSVVPLFHEQIDRGGPVTLTHPDVTRYFMTLNEAARLVLLAGNYTEGGEIFVLDMGRPVRIRQLAEQMIETAGYTVCDAANPDGDIEISVVGLSRGEKLHEELVAPNCPLEKTAHPKINRAVEPALSQIEVASALKALNRAIDAGSDDDARAVVQRWVGDFSVNDTTGAVAGNATKTVS